MPESNNPMASAAVFDPRIIAQINTVGNLADLQKKLAAVGQLAAELVWLGEPASAAESTNNMGGKYRHFTNGILYRYTHNDGKEVVGGVPRGGVYELWTKTHWEYGPFGYPIDMPEVSGKKTVCRFEGGTITSVAEKPRSVMFYNTALIGVDVDGVTQNKIFGIDKQIYTGRGRAAQLKALIDTVSRSKADVVVLAEMMGDAERAQLVKAVKGTFPHSAEGPDEKDPEEDSGLLVVSRHPIKELRTTIFRSCCGEDCLANKGAAMVRVSPADGPEFYVVGTHLQAGNASSCSWPTNAGVGTGAKGKREAQLRHLDSWILASRNPELPVIIVGDFNIDAKKPANRKTLADNLPNARDLWPEYQMWLPKDTKRYDPLTNDDASAYRPGKEPLPLLSPKRGKEGGRIDLALLDQGDHITAHVTHMAVYAYELTPGIDLSDHYAIYTTFDMSTVTHKLNRKVQKTTAWLKYNHALELTDGAGVPHWSKKDPDEVDVSARIYKGKPGTADRPSVKVEYDPRTMSMGERHEYSYKPGKTLIFDGSDDVNMDISLVEVDTVGPITTDRTAIGKDRAVVAPKASQLLHAFEGRRYAPNVMTGDGSEYVAIMQVYVTLEPFAHRREYEPPWGRILI
ncbi:endonuclease/exonuclease/phosphatase family protein [Nocardia sp. NBC_01009]|uniref:endonuclease/exonuclease/phosphatase family protein n=1 Tax=Nocardia sp. NBC_01009 TaxID=2975996 RepID=UPI003870381F|nr:endonuclease/exonuclease/phosphatase family protein [Nocardia sp. NBC_01009]